MRILLWRLGLLNEDVCPIDGSKLTAHGFRENDGGQVYTCDNERCKFNKNE